MKQGVRVSVLVLESDRLLLVRESDPRTGEHYWVPPGGGIEDTDASIVSCAEREVLEEAGRVVEVGPLMYLREFRDSLRDTRWLELYFLANGHNAHDPNARSTTPSDLQRDAQWFTEEELKSVVVYPEALRAEFWHEVREGLSSVRYLGSSAD